MRILYVTSSKISTFQAYYHYMRAAGHNIAVLSNSEKYTHLSDLKLFGYPLYSKLRKINAKLAQHYLQKRIFAALDSFAPDLVHFIHVDETTVSPFISEMPIPVIVTPVGSDIYRFPWTSARNYSSVQTTLRSCDMVLTLSKYAKDFLHHSFNIPMSKVKSKFWGIDCANIDMVTSSPSGEWTFPHDQFIILLPRGLREVFRPVLQFLATAKYLVKTHPNVRIVMLGWGGSDEMKHAAHNILGETGTKEFVTWIDEFLSHDSMLKLIRSSSMILSLAETDEMCAVVLEAMYLGTIPIISRLPSYEREFSDKDNLIMVNNGRPDEILAAVLQCINNFDEISERIQPQNRALVKTQYNTLYNMKVIESVYSDIIAKTGNQITYKLIGKPNTRSHNVEFREISDTAMLSAKPLLSIIMITYNHEAYIAEAINGVLIQKTDFPIELIIADDCSTDQTLKIVREYQKKHPDLIRVLTAGENVGLQKNAQRCYNAGRGEFVAICEGDDYWTNPHKLQKQVNFLLANAEYAMCSHAVSTVFEEGVEPHNPFVEPLKSASFKDVVGRGIFIPSMSMVFRRSAVPSLPDWFLNLFSGHKPLIYMITQSGKTYHFDNEMAVKRRNPGSITQDTKRHVYLKKHKITNLIFFLNKLNRWSNYKNRRIIEKEMFKCYKSQIIANGRSLNPASALSGIFPFLYHFGLWLTSFLKPATGRNNGDKIYDR